MEEKKVKDVMLSVEEYATVSTESTLKDALLALSRAQPREEEKRHHYRAVLVLNWRGQVVGKLSHWAVLRALEPHFFQRRDIASLHRAGLTQDFIDTMEEMSSHLGVTLEQMCRRAARVKTKDAMVPAGESIDESAPITEAIHRMVNGHNQSLLVSQKGEIVGILRLTDVFEVVAEMIRES
jgi:CBS domain-containing protein